jgi:DNA excision repair protein ERCC-4
MSLVLADASPSEAVVDGADLLPFQREITKELLARDGFCVLAEGLGASAVIAALVAVDDALSKTHVLGEPPMVTLIVGASEHAKVSVKERMTALFPRAAPPLEFTADYAGDKRKKFYDAGCVAFVTTRIASVDLLSGRLDAKRVRGIIVCSAHRTNETSGEGFVVRLFREGNRKGYVRAISDRPGDLTRGFNSVERCLKALMLTRVHLWPRFHLRVKDDLDARPPEVIELRQPMSENVLKIQEAIVSVMDSCMAELKKSRYIDTSDLTLESGLFKSFDLILQRQLDKVWHIAPRRVKQIVYDLKTLRLLADALLKYDSVTFLKYLQALRASESRESMWMFTEASHAIFEYAKKRVYLLKRKAAAAQPKGLGAKRPLPPQITETDLIPILEPMPKWTLMEEILDEIDEERRQGGELLAVADSETVVDLTFSQPYESQEHGTHRMLKYKQGATLIVCKEEHVARQLEYCIRYGTPALMNAHWVDYLFSRGGKNVAAQVTKRQTGWRGAGRGGGRGSGRGGGRGAAQKPQRVYSKLERIQARMEGREIDEDPGPAKDGKSDENKLLAAAAAEAKKTLVAAKKAEDADKKMKATKAAKELEIKIEMKAEEDAAASDDEVIVVGDTRTRSTVKRDTDNMYVYAHERKLNLLNRIQPSFVVMYDPDASFIRELEVYQATRPDVPVKVYFLVYDTSLEEQKYLSSIKRESAAFENLIRTKQHMAVPAEQEGWTDSENPLPLSLPSSTARHRIEESQEASTRKGGRSLTIRSSLEVIVDMREFMSALPCVLHSAGFKVRPTTLEVGDYILSPDMCVERKAIPDLIQSFASGRLIAQVEAMCKHYKTPILLIEFDGSKAFALHAEADLPRFVGQQHLITKICMLITRFRKLRLIWSRSMHMTAEIFAELKRLEPEPSLETAQRIGVPDADGDVHKLVKDNLNDAAVDLLRRLPGITDGNYRRVIARVESIEKMCDLREDELADILGDARQAKTLHTFLHAPFPKEFMF